MRDLIAITDITEMWASEVCIAGVNQKLECVRPILQGGVHIWDLTKDGKTIIFPGAKVWMDFSDTRITPPHIEDRKFNPQTVEYKDAFRGRDWETLLKNTSHDSVRDVFDGNLNERRVAPGAQTRSLGTIGNVTILNLSAETRRDGRTVLRMKFEDASGAVHSRFPVNDLAFRRMFSQLLTRRPNESQAADSLMERLSRAERAYLRVGLARPTTIGNYPESCWVQVTGVYTFPDYLDTRQHRSTPPAVLPNPTTHTLPPSATIRTSYLANATDLPTTT